MNKGMLSAIYIILIALHFQSEVIFPDVIKNTLTDFLLKDFTKYFDPI